MGRKLTYLATTALLLTLAFTGCQREPLPDAAVRFSVAPVGMEASSTKAIANTDKPTDGSNLIFDNSKVKLYGHLTPSGETAKTVFTGKDLVCTESSGTFSWGYTPVVYWERKAAYDFLAVFPHDASIQGNSINGLKVNYKMQEEVSGDMQRSDCDLMVASASVASAPPANNTVGLTFNHVCAAVRFVFKDPDLGANDPSKYTVTSFELQGLYTENTYDVSVSAGAWKAWASTASRAPHVWAWSGSGAVKAAYDYLWTPTAEEPGWYFAIPQDLDATDSKICFTYTVGTSTQALPVTLSLVTDNITKWELGKVYTYKIQIRANAIDFSVTSAEWVRDRDFDYTGGNED